MKTLSDRKDVISNLDNEVLSMLNDDEIEAEIMTSGDYLMSIDETIFGVADALERLTLNDDEKHDSDILELEGDDHPNVVKVRQNPPNYRS